MDDNIAAAERINKDGPVAYVSLTDSTEDEIDRLFIPYREYIDLIVEHPVVEMMLSVQYQGTVKNKMKSQEDVWKWFYIRSVQVVYVVVSEYHQQ